MTTREAKDLLTRMKAPIPEYLAEAKASKYGNRKVKEVDGIVFDSALEARAWRILKLWESAGHISCIERQPVFKLQEKLTDASGVKHRAIYYRADFAFWDIEEWRDRAVDCKGYKTEVFKLKHKLFVARYPLLTLELWTKTEIAAMERGK